MNGGINGSMVKRNSHAEQINHLICEYRMSPIWFLAIYQWGSIDTTH